jgi:GntR family carbon starvation induced transcriptional regulator
MIQYEDLFRPYNKVAVDMNTFEETSSLISVWRRVGPDHMDMNSICDVAMTKIRSDIIAGRLVPGAKLVVKDLSDLYGIGATPIRDALSQLVGTFLVVREAQRGFQVAGVSRRDLRDVARARKFAEMTALELSLQRADKVWADRVKSAHLAFSKVTKGIGDPRPIGEDWEETHRGFHFALLSCCDSPTLFEMCANLNDRFDRYRRLALPTRSFTGAVDLDHEPLSEAAVAGDAALAVQLLGRHIDDTLSVIEQNFVEPGSPPN